MDSALSGLIFASGLDSQGCALCGWIELFQGWVLLSFDFTGLRPVLVDGALSGLILASGLDSQSCALCGWIELFQGWVRITFEFTGLRPVLMDGALSGLILAAGLDSQSCVLRSVWILRAASCDGGWRPFRAGFHIRSGFEFSST